MNDWARWRNTAFLASCVLTMSSGLGAARVDDPRQILLDREARFRTKSDEHVGELTVTASNGKVRRKEWRSYREGSGASANRLIRFLSPPDVRGVGYLLRQQPGKAPEEWLYLPSMKRERRIVQSDRRAAFVGTDFTYEDLEEFDPASYELAIGTERTIDGHPCYAIQLTPKGASEYDGKVLVIRKDDLRLLLVEYVRKGSREISKRLTVSNYQTIDGHLVATDLEMADLSKGSKTAVHMRDILLDRPQPADRYTIQNLLREEDAREPVQDEKDVGRLLSQLRDKRRPTSFSSSGVDFSEPRPFLNGSWTGYVNARLFGFLGNGGGHDAHAEGWGEIFTRGSARIGRVRVAAAVRLEDSSSARAGPLVFDPADRRLDRSPVSLRELSLVVPVASGIDFQAGRFQVAWGHSEDFSPADAFLPRDTSDPLTDERLPLWGARLSGERHGVRFEVLWTATTTPWRLPAMDGRHSPLSSLGVFFVDQPYVVPTSGFTAARVSAPIGSWDIGAWARTGVRPAPILETDLTQIDPDLHEQFLPLGRRFANETAGGVTASREFQGWVVRGEVGVSSSADPDLGRAVIIAGNLSHSVRNGLFVGAFALNAIRPPVEPILLFDRGLLPAFILGLRQNESWGNWKIGWLVTLDRVGTVLTGEFVKDWTERTKITLGFDVPGGDPFSPARAISGGPRLRAAIRWDW